MPGGRHGRLRLQADPAACGRRGAGALARHRTAGRGRAAAGRRAIATGRTAPVRLTLQRARQLAVAGQLLDARRPKGIVDVVNRLGFLQMDPTAPGARTEHLVLWSRLGNTFKPAQLARKTYVEHELFEYRAFLYPTGDFPLYQRAISTWTEGRSRTKAREWIAANAAFRRYLLSELKRRGPLRSRDLEDRAVVRWPSSGWTDGRNTGQMLALLGARGEVGEAGPDRNDPPSA